MRDYLRWGVGAVCAVGLLAGCYVPERFNAKLVMKPDASYNFTYKGTIVNALAAASLTEGALSASEEKELRDEVANMKKDPGVRQAAYVGKGRYELTLDMDKKAGEGLSVFDMFRVQTDRKTKVVTISSPQLRAKDKAELKEMGITIKGKLEVSLPKNATVLSHNADATPKLGGLYGSYAWTIGGVDKQPMMKVQFK